MPSTSERPASADAGSPDRTDWTRNAPAWWPWGVGLLLGLVVLGPGLGGGSLLSLDLLVTPQIPVPNGVYGLGPALSQRVPLFALLGAGSALVGGPVITKVLLVVFVAAGFAGAASLARRLAPPVRPAGVLVQAAAGLLWAAGPFALTRIGVGHINLVWVIAVLPWALPRLCRPAAHLPSTYLASLALALGGPGGGTLGIAVALIALVASVHREPESQAAVLKPLAVILAPHALWILPTIVLLWAGAGVNGAGEFATRVDPAWLGFGLLGGTGFWRGDLESGAVGLVAGVGGLVVGAFAIVGGRDLIGRCGWRSWPGVATVVALIGLALAAATALPGARTVYAWLSELPFGAPLRESHRFLALWLVWAAPVAALGAAELAARLGLRTGSDPESPPSRRGRVLASRLLLGVPLVVAVVLSSPGWWGLDGRLVPVDYPRSWSVVRHEIERRPGTVVALPWSEYPPLSFADGRQVFNPLPEFLGGDVISSYDPNFDPGTPRQEQVDGRALVVDELTDGLRAGQPIGDALADLGVRWVVLVYEGPWEDYGALSRDLGLRRTLALGDVDLFEVVGWTGQATAAGGSPVELERPIPPLMITDGAPGTTLHVAGAPGWVQGWASPVRVTDDGRLELTSEGDVIWFWPAPVLLAADAIVVVGAFWAIRSRRRGSGRMLAPRWLHGYSRTQRRGDHPVSKGGGFR